MSTQVHKRPATSPPTNGWQNGTNPLPTPNTNRPQRHGKTAAKNETTDFEMRCDNICQIDFDLFVLGIFQ